MVIQEFHKRAAYCVFLASGNLVRASRDTGIALTEIVGWMMDVDFMAEVDHYSGARKTRKAIDFLLTELEAGPVESGVLHQAAWQHGIQIRALNNAKCGLRVAVVKSQQDSKWYWSLPV